MPISDPVDVTPASSLTSFQFQSEILNIFISSILISLIILNTESMILKLMQQTPRSHFSFDTFRRFIIFSGSDDPVRIISFLRGKYPFFAKHWKQYEQRFNLKLLLWPLSARMFLLVVAVGAIAAGIPREVILSGCEDGDFRFAVDLSPIQRTVGQPFCIHVPLVTSLGKTPSTLRYCTFSTTRFPVNETGLTRLNVQFQEDGSFIWELQGPEFFIGAFSYFQWTNGEGRSLYSFPSNSISSEQFLDALILGAVGAGLTCKRGFTESIQTGNGIVAGATSMLTGECATNIFEAVSAMASNLRLTFFTEKVDERQMRYDPARQQLTRECPIQISVIRPLVDIFTLLVTLIVTISFNAVVGILVSRRGNITDSWYHIVKEVLGYDCMSNVIQDSKGACSVTNKVRMQRVIRNDHGHVGFVLERNDDEVDDFERDTLVF